MPETTYNTSKAMKERTLSISRDSERQRVKGRM
jgi:hypothetical protein